MIKFHNTPAGKVQEFTPIEPGKVSIYTCGPTVYSTPHIGNFMAYIRWDILVRVLQANELTVSRVMNITDVGHLVSDGDDGEDKILKGALREGVTMREVADRYTDEFLEGMKQLNLVEPTYTTKATDFIPEQIELIKTLESKGFVYVIDDGVYYDTSKFPRYADFAHLDLEGMKAGARVDHNSQKRNISDFALWKFDTTGKRTEMVWDSPWGKGFPGWHLECSAMIKAKLGNTIDIHTGGIDHIPVHHTNEVAQSEAANDATLANYWLHCAHLLTDGTKISKSLGNVHTLAELQEKGYSPIDFRMLALQSHYRTESNFTWDNLAAAHNRLHRWRQIAALRWQMHDTLVDDDDKDNSDKSAKLLASTHAALEALNDDLNTPEALRIIEEAFDTVESTDHAELQQDALKQLLMFIDDVLGLKLQETTPDISDEQKQLILERQRVREAKDWKRSDEIRDELSEQGLLLNDTASGVRWSWK
jgi:cysteinyl-tRNA synthetase